MPRSFGSLARPIGSWLVAAILLLALGACALTPDFANLEARIVSDKPLELPRNAELTVTLRDADANSATVAEATYTRLGSGPIPVVLRYDDNAIEGGRRYVLTAAIRTDGRLLYTSPKPVPVLTGDAASQGRVEVPVTPVARP
ncbi:MULTISPECIES: YbaY family lipoprotein [unclassified Modicisalibacter]|uniref:YbaY family lipoprotein n=1 Tax=unclassified Modicisalibacter TaxID=2679913 RepID=UPI001CCE4C8A|nr:MULTISPECIES: YbaY family lipoprotein [unclassified Modicisalibacter]MBZ9559222.1 YbaY family lipoprotein [Modicisalibacter sp. R2A 31.J]MBZ9576613.1 YbaY family lipoprotein [Modicisalibacter sp. MOD 31.J]